MPALTDFVLDFCRAFGGLVEPPAYGVYEVLLPDAVAAQLGVGPLQQLAFDEASAAATGTTLLSYGHPLIERMLALTQAAPACTRFYINDVRLDKAGLITLARAALAFPNANVVEAPRAVEGRALFRYVRFNFKAVFISDEKREQLTTVLMDAQTGAAVNDFSVVEAHRLMETTTIADLPPAPAYWIETPNPLAPEPFRALLERAAQAAADTLHTASQTLQTRAARHLELDRARLDAYYADLERDVERRLKRADDDRKANLDQKLIATRADHAAKLADVEAKYRVRLDLDLINLAVISQPKIMLPVRIENRQASVTRPVVWDPLRHSLEPLACDICHRPHSKLWLCANQHLACEHCLAPACVDCKRVYCQQCAADITTCVVCDRPVCQKSLNHCRDCGRGTCHDHIGACHAAEGQPQRAPAPAPALPTPAVPPTKAAPKKPAAKRKTPAPAPAYKMIVQIEKDEPLVVAFLFDKDEHDFAQRQWKLTEWGIRVNCLCEKGWRCPMARQLLKPKALAHIEAQIEAEIAQFRIEYHVPVFRVAIQTVQSGELIRLPQLSLNGAWKDKARLDAARAAFPAEGKK